MQCTNCHRQWHAKEQTEYFVTVTHKGTRYAFCRDALNCPAVYAIHGEADDAFEIGMLARKAMGRYRR